MTKHGSFGSRARLPLVSALALGGALCCLSGDALALNELTVYGIANFGGTGQCGSLSDTNSLHTQTAASFKSVLDAWVAGGTWNTTVTANNSYARGTYWTDAARNLPANCSGCTAQDNNASYGVDSADVAFIHTHGWHDTYWSSLLMGNSSYGCDIYTNSNMLFGNTDLEVAVVKACQSGDRNTWLYGGYDNMVVSTSQFSMWNGFQGDSSCGSNVTSYVYDYAYDSGYNGLGENWVDYAYVYNGNNDDDCPTSLVFGETNKENQYRYGGFKDRYSTGSKTAAAAMYWISGCNAYNAYSLP